MKDKSTSYPTELYLCACENRLSYIWNNSQHSFSISSIQQLYKDIILQYWNPSGLCFVL